MKRLTLVVAAVATGSLCWERPPSNAPRAYALLSVEGYSLPVSILAAERAAVRAVPGADDAFCNVWITNGAIVIDGDSSWNLIVRRVNTCVTPADTTTEDRHGPLRMAGDSVEFKLDRTGFVLERGAWRKDSIIIVRRERHGEAGDGPPLHWVFAVSARRRPNER